MWKMSKMNYTVGQKIQKSPDHKKLVKSNKSISRKNFLTKIHFFCNFKNGLKSIFELEKSLKLPEMQFQEKQF